MTTHLPKIALIGAGHWGRNLARNFAALNSLAAVVETDRVRGEKIASEHRAPLLGLDEVLSDPDIDAVAIASPAVTHAALVERSLRAGKHVFVEKPLAMAAAEAELLCQLAAEKVRILMVGHLMRYHPAFETLTRLCDEGALGKIRHVYSNRLNLGRFRTEENILWSFAPHDISMILRIMGDAPDHVSAVGHALRAGGIQDMTITNMRFSQDRAAHVYVSWLHPFKEQRFVVVGESGMAVLDDGQDWPHKLAIFNHDVPWDKSSTSSERVEPEWVEVQPLEPLEQECNAFLNAIRTGVAPVSDGPEGLEVLKVLNRAQLCLDKTVTEMNRDKSFAGTFIHETAVIDEGCEIGTGTKIWHFSHVLSNTRIGGRCNLGQNVMVGPDVTIGDGCKIQNNVSVYPGVTLEDNVFCGPSVTFTNVLNPRSEIERKHEFKPTLVKKGATIGANATVVCDRTIGRYAFVGAGAVVIENVPDYGLVVGNPARLIGYMCACGARLPDVEDGELGCKNCGRRYRLEGDRLADVTDSGD